ncbi:hypothetical protein CLU79DRAFT_759772 [Phycomyces nitens]|nr:hypothetical protein CLU79DRAFT_759772 [Phycomyces nitens]
MTGRTATGESSSDYSFNKHSTAPNTESKPHRCNGHLEDVLTGVSKLPMDFAKPFSAFLSCLKSTPGQEPPRYVPAKPEEP